MELSDRIKFTLNAALITANISEAKVCSLRCLRQRLSLWSQKKAKSSTPLVYRELQNRCCIIDH